MFATGKRSMQHVFHTILPGGSTGKTLADSASVVGAKHKNCLLELPLQRKSNYQKIVQILSKVFWSAKSISVKNQVSYGQKLVKSIEINIVYFYSIY